MTDVWKPHATVATVVQDGDRFLFVEELDEQGRLVLNQPAGHLEPGEGLLEAALRETLEETGWEVELTGVIGLSLFSPPGRDLTYLRTAFAARPLKHHPERPLDSGIQRTLWLSAAELRACSDKLRSPLVSLTLEQFLDGHHYPLELVCNPE